MQGSRGREVWSGPHHPSRRSVEDIPDCVVAHAEEKTEVIPFGEHGARSPVNRNLPRHKVGAWMVVEGRGNNRGEGLGIGHVWGEIGACLDAEGMRVLGTMRGMGGVGGGGGVKEMQVATQESKRQPKVGRQTIAREVG